MGKDGMMDFDDDGRNGEQIEALRREAIEVVEFYCGEMKEVERLIVFAGEILKFAMPDVAGKIGIRWWKMKGGAKDREPVLVRWDLVKTGKKAGMPAKPTRIANPSVSIKSFKNGVIAYETAVEAVALINRWKRLKGFLVGIKANHSRYISGVSANGKSVKRIGQKLGSMHGLLVRDLIRQGSVVPDEFDDYGKRMRGEL